MFSLKLLCQLWGERFVGTSLVRVMGLIHSPDLGQHELSTKAAAGLSLLVCVPVSACAHTLRVCERAGAHTSKASIFVHLCLSPN